MINALILMINSQTCPTTNCLGVPLTAETINLTSDMYCNIIVLVFRF